MSYTVWNIWPWSLFLLGLIICAASVLIFHRRYPHYPWGVINDRDKRARDIMVPFHDSQSNIPRHRVPFDTPIDEIIVLLTQTPLVGVEDSNGRLIGVIYPEKVPILEPASLEQVFGLPKAERSMHQ